MDQDHMRWKSWKLIARSIRPTSLLFVAQRPPTYSLWKNLGKLEMGWGKVACWSTNAAISLNLKRVKIDEKLLWNAYRNSPTLFRTVPFATPRPPFPRLGVAIPTQNYNHYYTGNATDCKLGRYIHRVHLNNSH